MAERWGERASYRRTGGQAARRPGGQPSDGGGGACTRQRRWFARSGRVSSEKACGGRVPLDRICAAPTVMRRFKIYWAGMKSKDPVGSANLRGALLWARTRKPGHGTCLSTDPEEVHLPPGRSSASLQHWDLLYPLCRRRWACIFTACGAHAGTWSSVDRPAVTSAVGSSFTRQHAL